MTTITHGWTSAATPDSSDVTPTNMNDHTVDWAESTDLAPVAPAPAEGASTEIPRGDHVHQDSAAGLVYAYLSFR